MQAVFEDKEYVKVNVTGELSAPAEQEEAFVEIKEVSAEEVKEEADRT